MENRKKKGFYFFLLSFTLCVVCCLLLGYTAPYFHPDTIPFLPFFGLIYPISLGLTFVLIFVWVYKKSRWWYFCLFAILIGGKLHLRMIGLSFFNGSDDAQSIKIMSYNVRLFGLYDDPTLASRNGIFQFIREEQPDIACFQEYYRQDKPTSFETYDSLITILHALDYHERSAHNQNGHRNYGIAIFSKYPMIARGDVMFESQSTMDFNYCVFADIVAKNDTFRIYNVHLQSIRLGEINSVNESSLLAKSKGSYIRLKTAYSKRADQARKVIKHMQSSPYPIVVCGDFNDTPLSYTYNQFNKTLVDAFREADWGIGATYSGKIPAGRIDYIFHSDEIESYDFNVFSKEYSDHRPIACKIVIANER